MFGTDVVFTVFGLLSFGALGYALVLAGRSV